MRNLATLTVTFIAGTLGQGGAERQLYYIVAALRRAGARVDVLCLTDGEFWEERIRALGATVTWVGPHPSRARRLARLVTLLKRRRPDVVQSHHFYTNLYASLGARLLSLRDVGAVRSDAVSEVLDSGRLLGPLSLRLPRLVVANSRAGLANAMQLGVPLSRLHLLANVVDERLFSPSRESSTRPVTLLAVGRLSKEKRVDRFLTILARLQANCPEPVRALIVGDGPERPGLSQQAAALGLLPHTVEFRGATADTAPVYREADVLVLTSDREGTPNVVLEAMASGLPVVATSVGDLAEIVEDGRTGFLAAPDDEQRLVHALRRLVSSRRLRLTMGERGRRGVVDRYSLQQLPRRLSALYDSVLP